MSIVLHCNHCGKKISAPDGAGGKWGKCPACHNEVYIPDLNDDEELTLAPLDEEEQKQKKELMTQTHWSTFLSIQLDFNLKMIDWGGSRGEK